MKESPLATFHLRVTSVLCAFVIVSSFLIHRILFNDRLDFLLFMATLPSSAQSVNHSGFSRIIFLNQPDQMYSFNRSPFEPEIVPQDRLDHEHDRTRAYGVMDSADLPFMERRRWPNHEQDPECLPMDDWQSMYPINCNTIHETSMRKGLLDETLSLFGKPGFWRIPWKMRDYHSNETIVFKTFRLEHDIEEAYIENNRVDALAMERLTSSPHVINAFAYCGLSVMTQYASRQVSDTVRKYNTTELLRFAVDVTKGLVDIHNIGGKHSLVHNDINLANIVVTKDGVPMWNDFNIAILRSQSRRTGKACKFKSHFENPVWRAPEEIRTEKKPDPPDVDEKIDIYALGNIFYRLAVGRSPWKTPGSPRTTEKEIERTAKIKVKGGIPPVPASVEHSKDPAMRAIVKAMHDCFKLDPRKRPSADALLKFLSGSLDRVHGSGRNRRLRSPS